MPFLLPRFNQSLFKFCLIFSGGYLFAITLVEVLPELYTYFPQNKYLGVYILIGFLVQFLLEYFTQGIEHGHLHENDGHDHQFSLSNPITFMVPLCLHALLDGMILVHPPSASGHSHHSQGLLLGIVLHKAPAAFALVSVLLKMLNGKKVIFYTFIFALASPLGLYISYFLCMQEVFSFQGAVIFWAIAGGSFLHIATTIFFEASPGHHITTDHLIATLMGMLLALSTVYFG